MIRIGPGATLVATTALAGLLFACPPAGAGWAPAELSAQVHLDATNNAFPTDAESVPDRGVRCELAVGSSTRLADRWKLALEGTAGGEVWERIEGHRGVWIGAAASLRRGGLQVEVAPEWAPHRMKFPERPQSAFYDRLDVRARIRQGLPRTVRLTIDTRVRRDDFIASFDGRDARTRIAGVELEWKPAPRLALTVGIEGERTRTDDPKHAHDDHVASGSISWQWTAWRAGAGVESGVSRYTLAGPSDSNFRRRDQWLSLDARVARVLPGGLEVAVGGRFGHQDSSRLDRTYTLHSVRLGIAWASSAP